MKKTILAIIIILLAMQQHDKLQAQFNPPKAERIPVTDTLHGYLITDEYRWLENKEDPKVKDWSHKQHDYTVSYLKTKTSEITGLKDEIRAYIDRDYMGAPFFRGEREFFVAKKKGEQQYKLYTKIKGKDIKIFDPEVIDPTGKSALAGYVFTKDGSKVAVGVQRLGNEIDEYRIIDSKSGKILGESIKNLSEFSWAKDEKHAYITIRTQEMIDKQIPLRTYLHKIGDDTKNDIFLIAPKDAKEEANIWDPREGDVTFISTGDFYSNTLKIRKAGTLDEPKTIFSSTKYKADPDVRNGKIFFYTNYEAPNFKIMVADIDKPEFENWRTFYPEKKTMLESFEVTSDYVITKESRDVLSSLSAYDLNGNFVKELPLPEVADISSISYHEESNTVFVGLNTFTAATKVYKLDGKTLQWEFFYQDNPPIDTKNIESKMVFFTSKDSTRIPMFIVYKKGLQLDGNNPTLLYGYGGFNVPMKPGYLGTTASFINRGGVYALVCLRGGNEYGEKWHNDGMLFKKQNTFDDYIAAAEYLIDQKYTNPQKLLAKGGSNGGLLMGAVLTQRPDLFKASVCAVPLLDMLRYHKFLIARYWIPEYGDPEKKEDFQNILKYSPYQNIREGISLPTILVKCGENDSRVDPLHAKKFAAALQNDPWQKNPVMLFIDFESGHGSGQTIDQMIENISLEWRFVMNELGMK